MGDRLDEYRRKRDARRTPEPVPAAPGDGDALLPQGRDNTFVIQQHHARRLHWDLRLERNGVLVSWAVPRGIPRDPATNHLAVHTEDHPLEYATFSGDIPAGEYGAGRMVIYDRGTYETEKWRDDEVIVVLHGSRARGRYVLFRTRGKDWMIHRMDPPEEGWSPAPDSVRPMLATRATRLPADDDAWAYELDWAGERAIAHASGGRLELMSTQDSDVTATYPELRGMAEALAPTECVLDGEVVAFDAEGRISVAALQSRAVRLRNPGPSDGAYLTVDTAATRRMAARTPVHYLAFDLLWVDGRSTMDLSYVERRALLTDLEIAGPNWQTPPHFTGGGAFAVEASAAQGLRGVIAKRLESAYAAGRRTRDWLQIRRRS